MSISTLLSNEVILDQLVSLIDAKSGNVASVSGTAPIVVSPTAGECVVSLDISGTPVEGDVVGWSGTGEGLEWVAGGGGGGSSITSIDAGFAIAVDTIVPSAPVVSLNVSGSPSAGDLISYVPAVGEGEASLGWVDGNDLTTPDYTLTFTTTTPNLTVPSGTMNSLDLGGVGFFSGGQFVFTSTGISTNGEITIAGLPAISASLKFDSYNVLLVKNNETVFSNVMAWDGATINLLYTGITLANTDTLTLVVPQLFYPLA